ncbi:MAG: exodeoxyribonuclease V subunit gamma [Solirubrobacteraceae bacterium]
MARCGRRPSLLHVHRAERADRLADGLAQMLRAPLQDPFAADVVAVPTRGVERWLAQRLSTRLGAGDGRSDGVCANVEFPFPGRLIAAAVAAGAGIDPDDDQWVADRLAWLLLEIVDECLHQPWLGRLAAHLRGAQAQPEDPARRFGVVRRIADLFDRYAVHRPELLRGWAAGEFDPAAPDAWQARLWLTLRERIDQPSPELRIGAACARIRAEPGLLALAPRLSLFGLTRIPRSHIEVLAALAVGRDVHMFVLHPSPALWQAVHAELQAGGAIVRRRADRTALIPANPLLRSWGRDARELQLVLAAGGKAAEHHHPLTAPAPTLLARIQADVRADRQPPGPPLPGQAEARAPLDRDDRSLQVHACHGRARQVEVLRDALLGLLAADETLEPRDVIVMCPEIETYAPLIAATFGAQPEGGDGDAALDLRVRLADRSLRQTNPVLGVVAKLLELADQRVTASQLLDLADRDPVRRRFGFDDDDLARIRDWVVASGVHWGLHAAGRAPFKLDALAAGTWQSGLDRILAGVASGEEQRRLIGGVLPLDDVESGAIDLAGRLAEFIDRVDAALAALSAGGGIGALVAAIAAGADSLTATGERDSWQRAELGRLLDELLAQATHGGRLSTAALELADLRALLVDRLRGRPTRANFRTGHLTVCTLVPMRSVPHRVVCVLGLDDDSFPRRAPRDGDDLTLSEPQVGDRDPRSEDRQMLLDALLAATERLVITYTGNDERTNLPRPPAVPVGELLEAVERTVHSESGGARKQVLVRHPLQPFDPRNFTTGALVAGRPWSFDRVALAGARALAGPRRDPAPFLDGPLPALEDDPLELDRLMRFVEHPVRAFLRTRLGISVRESSDEVSDALPVALDALAEWQVGQRLLEGVLGGAALEDCVAAELARGSLPPGLLAQPVLGRVRAAVAALAQAAQELAGGPPQSLDVHLRLGDGRVLAGTVAGVCAHTIRRISYSRVRPRDRLSAWVALLALSAARPLQPWQSAVIGRAGSSAREQVAIATIPVLGEDAAQRRESALRHLDALIDLYHRGMREPPALACETSAAYARASAAGADARAAAQSAWETSFGYDKEDREPEHVLVHGGVLGFAALLHERPRADEHGPPFPASDATRFGRYARALWDGLLALEELTSR